MYKDHDIVLLMKKHPEMIDSAFSYISAVTSYDRESTKLRYEDHLQNQWTLFYFHKSITKVELGQFFDELAKNNYKNSTQSYVLSSKKIAGRYKQLLDQLQIRWLEITEDKLQEVIGIDRQMQKGFPEEQDVRDEVHQQMILFTESLLNEDLNTGWFDFSLLVGDEETCQDEEDLQNCKKRDFQLYYRHELKYEGSIVLSYEYDSKTLKWPRYIRIYLDELHQTKRKPTDSNVFAFNVDLESCIDWKTGVIFTEIPLLDHSINDNDMQRISLILQRWGLHENHIFRLNEYTSSDLEYFIQKLISLSMLIKASKKRVFQYV
ncbi:hypothetical protein CR194_06215 [Salipaludibacillus keqinensis]|uniref:Uncharacterized protein n=1 Tax=Salipaludibacillus keqinensis TaxID=2045207 RepID=A0A323TM51_9BACI|nr:hypothetical protein [Salipaludibacillus keqinensis]PYZ95106.1 hypothetical protein CR194_06215 [Salipaludibacillus keqinensis]